MYSISEALSRILRSECKKVDESAVECDVLLHRPLNTPYWGWAEKLTLMLVRTSLKFIGLASVENIL